MTGTKEDEYLKIDSQEYKQCFVGYLDILGFKELIKRLHPDPLTFMLRILKRDLQRICGFRENPTVPVKCPLIGQPVLISDSLLLYTKDDSFGSFKSLLNIIALIIQKGIYHPPLLFRGAISHGDFYFDHEASIYFGPALIDAIEWEKKQEWVGAILTPKCCDFVKANNYDSKITTHKIEGQKKTDISAPIVLEYAAPMKKKVLNCVKGSNKINFLCINWTIASPSSPTWLKDAFLWPRFKFGSKNIKKKYDNTFKFLQYCKRFEIKL